MIVVKLKDLTLDPGQNMDLASLAPAEASRRIKESFGFLADSVDVAIEDGCAVIRFPEPDPLRVKQAAESFERGIKDAKKGDYRKAIKYFNRALAIVPDHIDARRNLAMAYLEQGNMPQAKEHLLDCMKLSPEDSWTYVLLGNIATKHERAFDTAEFYYEKGLSIAPGDNYLLNNYAALLLERGKIEQARELFGKALAVDPSYPNTYLGLAMLERKEGHFEEGLSRLKEMFDRQPSEDIRSQPVYEQGRLLYLNLSQEMADRREEEILASVLARKTSLERKLGIPIQVIQDESLQNAIAMAQTAWRHCRNEHRILIRPGGGANAHLIAHEMEHIVLEHEARQAGKTAPS